jgi:hypothetical protein
MIFDIIEESLCLRMASSMRQVDIILPGAVALTFIFQDPRETTEDGPDNNERYSRSQGTKLRYIHSTLFSMVYTDLRGASQSTVTNQRNEAVRDDDSASDAGTLSDEVCYPYPFPHCHRTRTSFIGLCSRSNSF